MSTTKPIKRNLHALVPVNQLAFVIGTLFLKNCFFVKTFRLRKKYIYIFSFFLFLTHPT